MKHLLILASALTLTACCGCPQKMNHQGMQHAAVAQPTATLKVSGMTCEACAMSVTKNLKKINGVNDVMVDVPTGSVMIYADKSVQLDRAAIHKIINHSGYKLESMKTN